ncbi:FAD-binding protein [Halorussus limi]|uniref:D-lactate dehydrogenase (cytochrome) n=1 Tax=Halorussus limi TaxID=2938695 RepID=A0A8U0HSI2_9EURY|nr:FAD-linked oxidase C-terminal domain-containing protein [Halorussus limi]UPV73656.1 FAD-binding protein [Halorussus limi]
MTHDCSFLADLSLDGDVSFGDSARENHAADFGAEERGEGVTPDAVVWPESTADVAAVLSGANEREVPVTPYAAGTSLEGNAVPARRGVSLDLSRMDAVLDVRPGDFQIDVEPGVLGAEVDEAVADEGLFFPPLPSSGDISTVGGMIANDASGMKTVKYGEVADWVLELEVVLADGSVITAGSGAAKTSSGYNLKDLFVGSEGTLGVVTRATLELAGRPEQIRGARALFPSLDEAAAAVFDAVRSGVDVAKIELVDADSARMANAYTGTDLPDVPAVYLEFHANHGVEREIDFCRDVFAAHDVTRFDVAEDAAEMDDLWQARRDLAYAIQLWDPDLTALHPGDVTVPISAYPEMVSFVKSEARERDLLVPCFGHAGDGNLHYSVLVDEDDDARVEAAHEVYASTVEKAIDLGGTATGEHGIGTGKRDFLEAEHGPEAVEAMRRLKRAFDPRDTLNPGKMFPETIDGGRVRADAPDDGA